MLFRFLALSFFAASFGGAVLLSEEPKEPKDPKDGGAASDSAVQLQIRRAMAAKSDDEFRDQMEKLLEAGKTDRKGLLAEVVHYLASTRNPRENEAMAIVSRLRPTQQEIIDAVVPYLELVEKGEQARTVARLLLGPIEGDSYEAYIRNRKEKPPDRLVRYLYDRSPSMALLTFARAYGRDDPSVKDVLWAEHVVSDVLWKQENGFLPPGKADPAAAEQLDKLSHNPAWWARLYAAEIVRREPQFQARDLVQRLKEDKVQLVRDAVRGVKE